MATFNDSSKEKKKNEMAREQRGKYISIYIIYNGKTRKKNRNKQETDYNNILVGARTRDRKTKKTKEEMIINSRLNGSNLIWFCFFF
jgi:hypothetical protein